MRKNYLDNLRWSIIFQLILMHTCMCFNSSHLPFYYTAPGYLAMDAVMFLSEPWRQGAFFLISGMSMRFSCQKHGGLHYAKGRITKILIPFLVAKFTLIPAQSYLANINAGVFSGSFIDYMREWFLPFFFEHYIEQNAQLWFLKVLLVVTVATALFLLIFNRGDWLWELCGKADIRVLILLTVPVAAMGFTFRQGVYYFYGRYFIIFLLGYLMFSHDRIVEIVKEHCWSMLAITCLFMFYLTYKLIGTNYYSIHDTLDEALWYSAGWLGSMACVGIFARYFNGTGRVCKHFSDSSYFIFLAHQTILVYLADYIVPKGFGIWANYLIVTLGTAAINLALYEVLRHIPGVRFLLGIPAPKKSKTSPAAEVPSNASHAAA